MVINMRNSSYSIIMQFVGENTFIYSYIPPLFLYLIENGILKQPLSIGHRIHSIKDCLPHLQLCALLLFSVYAHEKYEFLGIFQYPITILLSNLTIKIHKNLQSFISGTRNQKIFIPIFQTNNSTRMTF